MSRTSTILRIAMVKHRVSSVGLSLLLPLLVIASGCGGGGGGSSLAGGSIQLSYPENPAVYTQGFPIEENVPVVVGVVDAFTADPPLPAGLTLDAATGVISGTPQTFAGVSEHVVTASNNLTSTQVTVSMTVLTPRPRGLFLVHPGDDTVAGLHVEGSTGALRHAGYLVGTGEGPVAAAVSPDGNRVFVANRDSGDVSTYVLEDGRPVASLPPVASGPGVSDVLVEPKGAYLYAANREDDSVAVFSIDASSGGPTWRQTVASGGAPVALAMHPSSTFLYALNEGSDDVSVFSVAADGTLTPSSITPAAADPKAMAIASLPGGRFAYVVHRGPSVDGVSRYEVDDATGALTLLGTDAAGAGPSDAVLGLDGGFLYVANTDDGTVSQFEVDPSTGALTPLSPPTVAVGAPSALALSENLATCYVASESGNAVTTFGVGADGNLSFVDTSLTRGSPRGMVLGPRSEVLSFESNFAYVANQTSARVSQFSVAVDADMGTVDLVPLSPPIAFTAAGPVALTLNPKGDRLFSTSTAGKSFKGFACSPDTGLLTGLGQTFLAGGPSDLAIERSGRFAFGILSQTKAVQCFTLDAATAGLLPGPQVAAGTRPIAGDVDPAGRFLYVADEAGDAVLPYAIDPSDGSLTALAPVPANTQTKSVRVHPKGRFVYATNAASATISMYAIDAQTGDLTPLDPPEVFAPGGSQPTGLDLSPNGRSLYATYPGTNQLAHFAVDPLSGVLTPRTVVGTQSNPLAVSVDAGGRFAVVANKASAAFSAYLLDAATGDPTPAGNGPAGAGASDVQLSISIR